MTGWWSLWRGATERAPEPPFDGQVFDDGGWLVVDGLPCRELDIPLYVIPSQAGWYYKKLKTPDGWPRGIVAHYTATNAGTAIPMAERRRDRPRTDFKDNDGHMPGSWHFTVAQDGAIVQQLSLRQGAFHAGSKTARETPVGWANYTCVGIELEGHGNAFPKRQVNSAGWLWREIVRRCGIKREHAMIQHSWIDPTRRSDPGSVWMYHHAPDVLDFAFESAPLTT